MGFYPLSRKTPRAMEQVSLHGRTADACEPQGPRPETGEAPRREKPRDGRSPAHDNQKRPARSNKDTAWPQIIKCTDFPDGPGLRLHLPMQKVWVQSLVREERCPARRCQQTKA